MHVVVQDVSFRAATCHRVVVEQLDVEAELGEKGSQPVGASIWATEKKYSSSTVRDRLVTAVSPLVALSYASAADMAGGISAPVTGGGGSDSSSVSTADEVGGGVGIEQPMRWSPLGRHGMTPSSK